MDGQELRRSKRRSQPVEEDEAELDQFRETHRRLSDRVERLVMQVVILGLVALVLVQMLVVYPPIRRLANLMEGTDAVVLSKDPDWLQALKEMVTPAPAAATTPNQQSQTPPAQPAVAAAATPQERELRVVLMNSPAAGAKLLVGGRVAGDFSQGSVTVRVKPGQLVVIDGTGTDDRLVFRVVKADGLAAPALGDEITTEGDRQRLGVARFVD